MSISCFQILHVTLDFLGLKNNGCLAEIPIKHITKAVSISFRILKYQSNLNRVSTYSILCFLLVKVLLSKNSNALEIVFLFFCIIHGVEIRFYVNCDIFYNWRNVQFIIRLNVSFKWYLNWASSRKRLFNNRCCAGVIRDNRRLRKHISYIDFIL